MVKLVFSPFNFLYNSFIDLSRACYHFYPLVLFIILTNPPIVEAKGQAMDAIEHEADQSAMTGTRSTAHQERGASGWRWYKRECHGVTTGDRNKKLLMWHAAFFLQFFTSTVTIHRRKNQKI
jgi:hypothetical protein